MTTRADAIASALAWFDDEDAGYFRTPSDRVAVPTESQERSQLPELYRYINDFIRPDFEDLGYEVTVYDNPFDGGGPVLLVTRIAARAGRTHFMVTDPRRDETGDRRLLGYG